MKAGRRGGDGGDGRAELHRDGKWELKEAGELKVFFYLCTAECLCEREKERERERERERESWM